jgi:hypothetical protein
MPTIYRYRMGWSGWPGQPGVTTLFSQNDTTEQVFADQARAFMVDALMVSATVDMLPSGISILGESIVDNIDPSDGTLQTAVPITPPAVIAGAATGGYASPSGACVTWLTGAVHAGHRVRGRTYFVPLAQNAFEANGTLTTTFLTNLRNAAAAYVASAASPCVWTRPQAGASDGAAYLIQASSVQDKAAVLTSRRD